MISWKTLKISFDKVTHSIILTGKTRHTRTTKYIRTREEFGRWQWFLEQVWNARFKWDPDARNSLGEKGAIVKIDDT